MSRLAAVTFCFIAFCIPLSGAMAASTQILCTDMPQVDCGGDFTKPSTCRDALNDKDVQKKINNDICCTGSADAKVFTTPAAPTPPAQDTICTDFAMTISGKGTNRKLSVKVNKDHCNGDKCPKTAAEAILNDIQVCGGDIGGTEL